MYRRPYNQKSLQREKESIDQETSIRQTNGTNIPKTKLWENEHKWQKNDFKIFASKVKQNQDSQVKEVNFAK